MRGLLGLAVLAASLSLPGQASAATARSVPPQSFLEYRAGTVEALALQAERNPRVRARYARHFGIPASRVARFIRENLVVSYLPTSGRQMVYYVEPGGRITCRQTYLPRGTRVLALRNGQPVLQWLCGNAMVPELPRVAVLPVREAPAPQVAPVVSVPTEQIAAVPVVVSAPFEQVAVRQVVPPAVPVPVPAPVVPVPAPAAPQAVPIIVPAVPVPAPAPVRSAAVIPIVGALPPISFAGGEVPPPPVTELPPPEIPVPEPGSLAMLVLAAGPMAWATLRGRRRSA